MKMLKSLLCVLLILLLTISIAGCGGSGSSSGSSSETSPGSTTGTTPGSSSGSLAGGIATRSVDDFVSIKIGVTSWLGRFIQGLTPTECWPACDGVFDAIFKVDQVTKQIFSECLEDWYYEDDVTMIMKLKENVYFSNGMHATAEDLLYSYTSIIDRGSSQVAAIGPIIWEECITLDEYTVQFKFDRPFRPFENVMVYLLCKEWSLSLADGWEDMAWYYPVGSGPYECVEFKSEDIIVIRARDEYWNTDEVGPVYVDEWIIKFYKDYATMVMDLEIGEIAFCSPEPPDYNRYIRSGASGDGYEMFPLSTGCTMYFVFSFFDYPAWEDKRLREAVAVGVDWESLGSTTYQALYTPAESILPRNSRYFFAPGKYEYNPDRARELLAEAGYGPNNPLRLATTVSDEQQYKSNSENIQYQFSEIGIEADITVLDAASAIQAWNTGGSTDFMFWFRATGSPLSDPYEIMSGATRETGTTCTRVLDPKFRELWFTMVYNTDPAIYEPAIREIQQYNFDEIIYIPFAEYNVSIAYRTDVFTEAQLRNFVYGRNMYQLRRLGMLSSWE